MSEIYSKDLIDAILKLILDEINRKESEIKTTLDQSGIIYTALQTLKNVKKSISSEKFIASIITTLLKYYEERKE